METGLSSEWYDPRTNQWHCGPSSIRNRGIHTLAIINDNLVFDVGGYGPNLSPLRSVDVLDLSSESPCWKPSVGMLVDRLFLGVGVINNNIYAVSNVVL